MGKAPPPMKAKRELMPSGNHVATLYQILNIGTVDTEYMGEISKKYLVNLTWEVPSLMRVFNEEKGEQPMVISREYTFSMAEKANLRKDIQGWLGSSFTEGEAENYDISDLLGKSCLINVIHRVSKKDTEYVMIAGITPIPEGLDVPESSINPIKELSFEAFDNELFESLPEWLRDKISSSDQYKEMKGQHDEMFSDEEMNKRIVLDNTNEEQDDLPWD